MNEFFDVVIIGGGPGGMYSSIIGSLINISSAIIEINPFLGGQPIQLYAEKNINDFPGFKEILPADLINGMNEQINNLEKKPKVFLNSFVNSIEKENDTFIIRINNEIIIKSNFIIIATGSGSFLPTKSEVLEKANFENIHYVFDDKKKYIDKEIVILGGGDSALDWANFLFEKKISNKITIIHRREEFRAREEKIIKLKKNNIRKFLNYEIIEILKNELLIKSNENDNLIKINYDFIIVQYGQKLKLQNKIEFLKDLNINENKKIHVDINCQTNIKNIYAIGNSNYFDSKPNLIICACAEGARAMYHIRNKKNKK